MSRILASSQVSEACGLASKSRKRCSLGTFPTSVSVIQSILLAEHPRVARLHPRCQSRNTFSVSAAVQVTGWRTNKMPRRKHSRRRIRCRDCPFHGPSNRCLNTAIKSGLCGDWVWYMRGRKQCRRHYTRPKDPHTLAQAGSRGRLTAASRKYSESLTDKQREACIAAGAKVQSRPRLGQSGPLTGQQYWIRRDYARQNVQSKVTKLVNALQMPQPQALAKSTWGTHRGIPGVSPEQRRIDKGAASNAEGRRKKAEGKNRKARAGSEVLHLQRLSGIRRGQRPRPAGVRPSRPGRNSGTSHASGRAIVLASPNPS